MKPTRNKHNLHSLNNDVCAMAQASELFTHKAAIYIKARPNYPVEAVDYIFSNFKTVKPTVVDIGAGPGRFTQLLMKRCSRVYAIEPNESMRKQLTIHLRSEKNLEAIDSYAEETGLPSGIADIVTVAHAFHWFDKAKCKEEFTRVLKKGGKVALLWNIYADTPAMQEYDNIIHGKCAIKEALYLREKEIEDNLNGFFVEYEKKVYNHRKEFEFSSILSLSESAHCTPIKNEHGHEFMVKQLIKWFDKYKSKGKVEFSYNCILFFGDL